MNKPLKIIVGLVVLVIIAAALIPRSKSDVIHVGVILPLSGQYAALGESDRNAIVMAKADLKADNIELYFEDDKYDARTAVTAYQKLRSINNIDVVVVLSAPSIQAIQPLTNKDKIPLLGLGATLVYEKDSVFQLMPSGDTLFVTLGETAGKRYKNIAVVHGNADLFALNGRSFIKGLPQNVHYTDITLVPSTDYRTEVQKIIQLKPEAVTTILPKEDALKFLQTLRVQDASGKIKIICDFGTELAADEYTAAIGKDRLEGCVSTNLADTSTGTFKEKYKSLYSSDPMITADYAYDSVGLIKKLITASPKQNWIETLSSSGWAYAGAASGEIKFNEDGTRFDVPPKINIFKNGKFIPLEN